MGRLLFVVIAFVFILAAYGNNSSEDKETGKNSKTINVDTEDAYTPFNFYDKDGKLTDYDIDVIKAVVKAEGLKLKFGETSWDSMFAGLDAEHFDIITNQVGINPDREERYKFSKPYTSSSVVLVIREDERDTKNFSDIKGKKLAQIFTSNYGKLAKDKGTDITRVDGLNQSMNLLLSKRVDGTFDDSLSYLDYRKQKSSAKIKAIEDNAEQGKSVFAFSRKVDDETVQKFNDGLKKIEESGELAKVGKKWFS